MKNQAFSRGMHKKTRTVAQVSNLPYRRFPIGRAPPALERLQIPHVRRLEALRYSRLEPALRGVIKKNGQAAYPRVGWGTHEDETAARPDSNNALIMQNHSSHNMTGGLHFGHGFRAPVLKLRALRRADCGLR